ncbi:unnamed protein product [Caenorhabditis nigoni]
MFIISIIQLQLLFKIFKIRSNSSPSCKDEVVWEKHIIRSIAAALKPCQYLLMAATNTADNWHLFDRIELKKSIRNSTKSLLITSQDGLKEMFIHGICSFSRRGNCVQMA